LRLDRLDLDPRLLPLNDLDFRLRLDDPDLRLLLADVHLGVRHLDDDLGLRDVDGHRRRWLPHDDLGLPLPHRDLRLGLLDHRPRRCLLHLDRRRRLLDQDLGTLCLARGGGPLLAPGRNGHQTDNGHHVGHRLGAGFRVLSLERLLRPGHPLLELGATVLRHLVQIPAHVLQRLRGGLVGRGEGSAVAALCRLLQPFGRLPQPLLGRPELLGGLGLACGRRLPRRCGLLLCQDRGGERHGQGEGGNESWPHRISPPIAWLPHAAA
jgi:hypothetical protein